MECYPVFQDRTGQSWFSVVQQQQQSAWVSTWSSSNSSFFRFSVLSSDGLRSVSSFSFRLAARLDAVFLHRPFGLSSVCLFSISICTTQHTLWFKLTCEITWRTSDWATFWTCKQGVMIGVCINSFKAQARRKSLIHFILGHLVWRVQCAHSLSDNIQHSDEIKSPLNRFQPVSVWENR